jgi:hypothetical protein
LPPQEFRTQKIHLSVVPLIEWVNNNKLS